MFHMLTRGLIKKESPSAMAFMFFKHPPTEARTLAKPQPASHSFDERQLESGFGGWVDEKIKPARAAHPHVSNECCLCGSIPEKTLKRRNSHPQHLTITLGTPSAAMIRSVSGIAAKRSLKLWYQRFVQYGLVSYRYLLACGASAPVFSRDTSRSFFTK